MNEFRIQLFPFVLLRTPLQGLRSAYQFSKETSVIFQEGLYLSSPEFWQEYRKEKNIQSNEKLNRSFLKYWLRSSTRCTPYGTFAGSTVVNISDDETSLIINENTQHYRKIRIDMNYLTNLITAITKMSVVLNQIKFFPNNSIYYLSESLRYAEYSIIDNTRHYHLTSVENTNYLIALLHQAQNGATISELVISLIEKEGVNEEEANAFITSLWESQLLISEIEPCVTGKEPFDKLIEQLSSLKEIDDLLKRLKEIQKLLICPKEGVEHFQEIEKKLTDLALSLDIPKNTLQVDLFLSTHKNNFNRSLIQEVIKQISDLTALSRPNNNLDLENFKTKFYSKYEDIEVPISVALDADLGIGYAGVNSDTTGWGEAIENLAIRVSGKQNVGEFDYILQYTLSKYYDFLKNHKSFIEIKEDELKSFEKIVEKYKFPNSMYIMGDLLKRESKVDKDSFIFDLSAFGGPSAGNLLGRFTSGDNQIYEATREVLSKEELEYPNAIYAEIAHLPQARIGNILLRPVLRKHEIPYVGKSGAILEDQISIEDIMVSIRNNEVILRSKKHNKRIIPRLTTAHNFGFRSLPMYKFLCDLQGQGLAYPNVWDWGHLDILKYLPRVVYKNIIVKKARWKIEEKDINDLPTQPSEYVNYFKSFCKKWEMISRVVYKESDNELLIDFNEMVGIDLFLHYLRRHKNIVIEEFLFDEKNCIVTDLKGEHYTNEIIIPIYQETLKPVQQNPFVDENDEQFVLKRKFSPNSEWLYFKIYCGAKTAEKILKDAILSFIEMSIKERRFEHFFFIRYKDEFPHLRIRFFNSDMEKQFTVQKEFMKVLQPFLDNDQIDNVVVDTYSRELKRYGKDLIVEAEQLFHNDSLAILRFINLLEDREEKYRLLFALRGIDMLLDDFNLNIDNKLSLAKKIQTSFFNEFGGHLDLQQQLNDKYRKYQKLIFTHMDNVQDEKNEIEEAVAIFNLRSEMNKPIVTSILSKLGIDDKRQNLYTLLPSYIHMFMNRLFITQQRKYELVVYHFLERYYTSQVAIRNKKV